MHKVLREVLPNGAFYDVDPRDTKRMSRVRASGNRSTEIRLKLAFVRAGLAGWKVQPRELIGRPDFWFPMARLVVFVDGCFWHSCPNCGHQPSKNSDYWHLKLEKNRTRDERVTAELEAQGYRVVRFWEHQVRADLAGCVASVRSRLQQITQPSESKARP